MSEKQHGVAERLPNYKYIHRCEIIGTLFVWGLFFLTVILLLSFAYLQFERPVEGYDLSFGEDSLMLSGLPYLFTKSIRFTAVLTIFTLMLWFVYLRSHIGEKQPPDRESESNNRFSRNFRRRRYSAVSSLLFYSGFGKIGSEEIEIQPFCKEEAACILNDPGKSISCTTFE